MKNNIGSDFHSLNQPFNGFHCLCHKLLVVLFVCFSANSCMAAALAKWPSPLIIDADRLSSGLVGDILYSIPVSHAFTPVKILTGAAFLQIDNHFGSYDGNKGVYYVNSDRSIGVAFTGTLNLTANGKTANATKSQVFDSIVSIGGSGTKPAALIQQSSPSFTFLTQIQATLTGEIHLVRLKTTPITLSELTLPTIKLTFNSLIWDAWKQLDEMDILTTDSIIIGGNRSCQIAVSGTEIDFGSINADLPPGELDSSKRTVIRIQCSGISKQNTKVFLSVDSPTEGIGNDISAIGMKFGDQTSSNLVVKAKIDNSVTADCASSTNWLDLSQTHQIGTFDKSLISANQAGSIYWSLCRKTNEALPIGNFNGIATISVTFK